MELHVSTTRWLPFALFPSAPEEGRPQPELLELRLPQGVPDWPTAFKTERVETVQVWPVDTVLKNFVLNAALWHVRAKKPRSAAVASIDELRQWVALTRSLAGRLPFNSVVRADMLDVAGDVDRALDWPDRYFSRWPQGTNTPRHANWRVNLNLWAIDGLVRALNETASPTTAPILVTKLWPAAFKWFPTDKYPDPVFSDYNEARKRIDKFKKTIKRDTHDALMVELLGEVFHAGRLADLA